MQFAKNAFVFNCDLFDFDDWHNFDLRIEVWD